MREAIEALRAGDRQRAFLLLRRHLNAHPADTTAWLWMSEAAPESEQQKDALRQALRLSPDHPHAAAIQQRLRTLESTTLQNSSPQSTPSSNGDPAREPARNTHDAAEHEPRYDHEPVVAVYDAPADVADERAGDENDPVVDTDPAFDVLDYQPPDELDAPATPVQAIDSEKTIVHEIEPLEPELAFDTESSAPSRLSARRVQRPQRRRGGGQWLWIILLALVIVAVLVALYLLYLYYTTGVFPF
jgi:hypothetical protein